MPCIFCTNPALCNPVCRAFEFAPDAVKAQMREACAKSGQMTAQQIAAHVEAGEMKAAKAPRVGPEGWRRLAESQQALIQVDEQIRDISAGLEAATPLPTHPQQEKPQ